MIGRSRRKLNFDLLPLSNSDKQSSSVKESSSPVNEPSCSTTRSQMFEESKSRMIKWTSCELGCECFSCKRLALWTDITLRRSDWQRMAELAASLPPTYFSNLPPSEFQTCDPESSSRNVESVSKLMESPRRCECSDTECSESTSSSESLHSESYESSCDYSESLLPKSTESSNNRSESLHSESLESSNPDSKLPNQELNESLKRKKEISDSTSSESSGSDSIVLGSTYTEGPFSDNYVHLKSFCKGTFGYISKGYRKSDGLLVITKFIRKTSISNERLVYSDKLKKEVPIELSVLHLFDHPNIIKVHDVFENDNYFHLVMEKHGCGMDLFDFNNRNTCREDPLICYIFRQIVDALSFLHHYNNVVHRDIKEDNILINENFHVKLIDFGSAAIMTDEPFTKFLGTKQFCSPEVLRGEKYRGPELEMFALGVTLYTLAFGDLPFENKKEILENECEFPKEASEGLVDLITGLLEPVPDHRLTLPEVEINKWVKQYVEIERYSFAAAVNATEDELHPSKYKFRDLKDSQKEGDCFSSMLESPKSNFLSLNDKCHQWLDDSMKSVDSDIEFLSALESVINDSVDSEIEFLSTLESVINDSVDSEIEFLSTLESLESDLKFLTTLEEK